MFPIILTVIEISAADSYGTVAFQVSSPDLNFNTGDMVRFTVDLSFLDGLSSGDQFTADMQKILPETPEEPPAE